MRFSTRRAGLFKPRGLTVWLPPLVSAPIALGRVQDGTALGQRDLVFDGAFPARGAGGFDGEGEHNRSTHLPCPAKPPVQKQVGRHRVTPVPPLLGRGSHPSPVPRLLFSDPPKKEGELHPLSAPDCALVVRPVQHSAGYLQGAVTPLRRLPCLRSVGVAPTPCPCLFPCRGTLPTPCWKSMKGTRTLGVCPRTASCCTFRSFERRRGFPPRSPPVLRESTHLTTPLPATQGG